MSFSTYAVLTNPGGFAPAHPLSAKAAESTAFIPTWGPMIVLPLNPVYVANGNGVTLVQGQGAAGARPVIGQQWPRGSHVVLSQFATTYAGIGQRV